MAAEPVPRREVVTRGPAPGATAAPVAYRPVTAPPGRLPPAARGEVRRLIRAQLRAGLAVGGTLAVLVAALPLLLRQGHGDGPVPPLVVWAVLGVAVYPLFLALAGWYVRRAERNERAYRRAAGGS
ncbi:hypothetical protein AB0A60_17610 [Streptomyces sp. NPDC046275]|uniref:hypothetical protein n=1 Tax=Streptomyces sp. NPDC046275 TaxID=3157201 RepID=UPI0033C35B0B